MERKISSGGDWIGYCSRMKSRQKEERCGLSEMAGFKINVEEENGFELKRPILGV